MRTLLTLAVLLAPVAAATAQDRQVIHTPHEVAGLPFSSAVRVGNLLFLAGQIGNVPGTRQLADTGITGQTRATLENIKAVLDAAGSSLDRAVKCTVFLSNIAEDRKSVV